MKRLLLIFAITLGCMNLSAAQVNIDQQLRQVPLSDRIFLNRFFSEFYLYDCLGHVLFYKTKPACLTGALVNDRHFMTRCKMKGWRAWKKYEHLFPHPKYLICEDIYDSDLVHILVINKKSLSMCLQENRLVFLEILGSDFSAEKFMSDLEKGAPLYKLIGDDEALRGIILGFGSEASLAFKKRISFPPTSGRKKLEAAPYFMFPVAFIYDPQCAQSSGLTAQYEKEFFELMAKYNGCDDPLKLILRQLVSE